MPSIPPAPPDYNGRLSAEVGEEGARGRRRMPLIAAAPPQGATGYAAGRPKPRPVFSYWPCLIAKVSVTVEARLVADVVGATRA